MESTVLKSLNGESSAKVRCEREEGTFVFSSKILKSKFVPL